MILVIFEYEVCALMRLFLLLLYVDKNSEPLFGQFESDEILFSYIWNFLF